MFNYNMDIIIKTGIEVTPSSSPLTNSSQIIGNIYIVVIINILSISLKYIKYL